MLTKGRARFRRAHDFEYGFMRCLAKKCVLFPSKEMIQAPIVKSAAVNPEGDASFG